LALVAPLAGGVSVIEVPGGDVAPFLRVNVYEATVPPEFDHVNVGLAFTLPSAPANAKVPIDKLGGEIFKITDVVMTLSGLVTFVAVNTIL
jgi:hypothetical protein